MLKFHIQGDTVPRCSLRSAVYVLDTPVTSGNNNSRKNSKKKTHRRTVLVTKRRPFDLHRLLRARCAGALLATCTMHTYEFRTIAGQRPNEIRNIIVYSNKTQEHAKMYN